MTAERELAEELDRLRRTGGATPEVERPFASTMSGLRGRLQGPTQIQFLDQRCFRAGCTFTMQFPEQTPHEAVDTALFQDEAFTRWPGSKFRSGVFPAAQKMSRVSWILFFDDAPAAVPPPPTGQRRTGDGNP